MKFFKKMERYFEKHIEGFFRKYFAAGIQPVEVGKKLIRAMEENIQISVTKTYAPNHYTVSLNPEDLKRMQSLEISLNDELAQYITRRAEQQNISIVGAPLVEMREDAALSPGEMRVGIAFVQETDPQRQTRECTGSEQGTQVFQGMKGVSEVPVKHKATPCASLRVQEGIDAGKDWELGANRVYIGRRQTNEIALNDMSASRVHAYIVMEDGRHVVHDAKSLNGTYVNEERIMRKVLCPGDRIKIGHSTLVYEVM